jgi:hypothetical protein
MKEQMHLAAQYLAAAGISFLDKKADDSHTNLGFDTERGCLSTHVLSKNEDQLLLNYEGFSLQWVSKSGTTSLKLDEATHKEVLNWLNETSMAFLSKPYAYKLHYQLPYEISDAYTFKLDDANELVTLMMLRQLAQVSLEKTTEKFDFDTSIRVWPHHFDTGIYTKLIGSEISVGLGLAIPDNLSDTHYLYASGYDQKGQINPSEFQKLSKGNWNSSGFLGALLPAKSITMTDAVTFFEEAILQYKK